MSPRTRKPERRAEALTREGIIETAVELLDAAGEGGLTFRVLTERLATGAGAIYWHVANKGELLAAATDAVVTTALANEPAETSDSPQSGIHAIALGLFNATVEHPWLATQLATQLSRNPGGPVTPRIFEGVGRQVCALGVPKNAWFTATSALVHYILGTVGQHAANTAHARTLGPDVDRAEYLDAASTAWEQFDADGDSFLRAVADQARSHDDREQFLAGLDFLLAGITALHPPTT
ncbi:TetR/AcrR family transcriptional regulator [Streptomyces albogriseolus]|uniref:TetR/AcrR family transcriptional regulator n=1 Tax=Streptomyces albogriseolus TaxID=1887 RepID=UPI0037030796